LALSKHHSRGFAKQIKCADLASLAHAELYLTLARVVCNFDMDLYNTTVKDVQIHTVLIIGQPEIVKGKGPGQGEVKVKVTKKVRDKLL